MTIKTKLIADGFVVSAQLTPEDFADLARLGVRSVINNRPDGEGGGRQPGNAALRAAAEDAGIFYAYLPAAGMQFDPQTISRMRALVGELPKPIVAFCRSGNRSAALYRAAYPERHAEPAPMMLRTDKTMQTNVGGIDRAVRIVLGVVLVGATLAGFIGAWGWLGVGPLATGLLGFCPAYMPFGFTTARLAA